jgi:hypothetical protein
MRHRVLVGIVVPAAAAIGVGVFLLVRGAGSLPQSWHALPPAPIRGRIAAVSVWSGREMLVWGGTARTGTVAAMADGAAFAPATRTWRVIPSAPPGVRGGSGGGAWTGRTLVVWAGNSPDGPAGGAVYDPAAGTWRRLPAGPLGPREGYSTVWTGTELLVVGGTSGDVLAEPNAAAVDPATGAWRLLPALNRVGGLLTNGAVWAGRELFVTGRQSLCPEGGAPCNRSRPVLLAYDPARDALRTVDLAQAPLDAQQKDALTVIARHGTDVILATTGYRIVRYRPATGAWRLGKPAPCPPAASGYAESAWLGDRFAAACGGDRVQLYDLATDSWQTIPASPSPFNSRFGSAVAWTGRELIVWSGTVYERMNPTPNSGASLELRRPRR